MDLGHINVVLKLMYLYVGSGLRDHNFFGFCFVATQLARLVHKEQLQEEEEETGIASDVVKVKSEDPATSGCLRSVDTRKPNVRNEHDSTILG